MHYYPSTIAEMAQALMDRKDGAALSGRKVVKLRLGEFQQRMILADCHSPVVEAMEVPTVQRFMDVPVEVSGEWAFDTEMA